MSSSSYPYDLRLLDDAPKVTAIEKHAVGLQEGRNFNPLAGDNSGEHETSGYRRWTHLRKKWKILVLMGTTLVIGAIIGGAVGGTLASKNTKSDISSTGTGPSTSSLPPSMSSTGALAQSTTSSPPSPGFTSPPQSTSGVRPSASGIA